MNRIDAVSHGVSSAYSTLAVHTNAQPTNVCSRSIGQSTALAYKTSKCMSIHRSDTMVHAAKVLFDQGVLRTELSKRMVLDLSTHC